MAWGAVPPDGTQEDSLAPQYHPFASSAVQSGHLTALKMSDPSEHVAILNLLMLHANP